MLPHQHLNKRRIRLWSEGKLGVMGSTWILWPMSLTVVITLLQIQALISDKTTAVTGTEGETLHFRCEYPKGSDNSPKYLCYPAGNYCSSLIRADRHNEWVKKGRFSLYDNTSGAFFIVGVDELRSDDSGTYMCGVDLMFWSDHLSLIKLNVSKANISPAVTTDHTVPKFVQQQLFLTAVLCVVAIGFVCLFTLCLMMTVKQRRSRPRQKKETSPDCETMMPCDKKETDLCCTCGDPSCPYRSALPMPPADHNITSKYRQSVVSVAFSDYADIDVPKRISQYQHLNLSELEDHIYESLHENCSPKHRAH